jgi:tetratricopeptide (TPR) repeat protein
MRHLTAETVPRLTKGELPPEERNEAVRHLLTRCPQCARITQSVVAGERADLDFILDRLEARQQAIKERIQQERSLAAHQWASLQKYPQAQRLALVEADSQMHTWGLCDTLLEAARQAAVKKTGQAVEVADLALAVAISLDKDLYGETLIADYQAAAMAVRGNCKRVAKDFEGARADLEAAWELLKHGTGDPLEKANLLSLRGSWNTDSGFCKEAEELFARAINLYRLVGNDSMAGRTMIGQALAIGSHDPGRAILVLEEASGHIDPIQDPWAELCRRHNLAWYLNEVGHTLKARRVLEDSRGLYREFRDPKIQLQLQWLEGRIHQSLGNTQKAEEIFEWTAADFLERDLPLECLLCGLDLARVLFVQGDRTGALQICKNLYHLFSFRGMPTERMAVLLLLIALLKQR